VNFSTINNGNADYPSLLAEIDGAPSTLYVRGSLPAPDLPAIAIVGTRKATKDGRDLAERIAKGLADAGVVVVSGLAMGIDTAAHKGALFGKGKTIAVLGNGIDSVYPASNEKLAKQIIDGGGAIVSEYGPGEPSYKGNFIERNRIISGLSLGTVVVEAPARSGALATARFAGEQGRSVFVFPGAAKSVNYEGSHALIRDGAMLVTKTSEILEDLGLETFAKKRVDTYELRPEEHTVVQALTEAGKPLSVDMIIELTKLEPHMVSKSIAMLTIYEIVKESELGYEISNS